MLDITDRNGNVTLIEREGSGNIIRIVSPSGRWVGFTYDGSYRVTQWAGRWGQA